MTKVLIFLKWHKRQCDKQLSCKWLEMDFILMDFILYLTEDSSSFNANVKYM